MFLLSLAVLSEMEHDEKISCRDEHTIRDNMSGAVMEVLAIKANREVDLVPMRLKVNY